MGMFNGRRRGVAKVAAEFDALQSDFQALQKDARRLADGIGHATTGALHSVGDAYGDAEEWTSRNVHSLKGSVRRQPLAACALSMTAGALLTALFFRR
ncbi:MAG TPA: hypothetical protein VGF97_02515 [Rhizomicrobium sp.]|jgi:hypothetical protein